MEMPQPQEQHKWLQRMVGDWTFESECSMGPDQPPGKFNGQETVRALGDFWIIGEGSGEMPGGGTGKMVITLGFDPKKNHFVGTWVGSMMNNLWVYDGVLESDGKTLPLNAEGPCMTGEGNAKYQDIIELVDDDHRILRSQMLGADGQWQHFMTGHYYRKK
jgi:hypothetical protein